MTKISLQWSLSLPALRSHERYAHLFLLVQAGKVVYIGNAYRKSVEVAIRSEQESLGIEPDKCQVWLGRIREVGSGVINPGLVADLESLMIFANKPIYNGQKKFGYHGRAHLNIHNLGCNLLRSDYRVDDSQVYLSMKFAHNHWRMDLRAS